MQGGSLHLFLLCVREGQPEKRRSSMSVSTPYAYCARQMHCRIPGINESLLRDSCLMVRLSPVPPKMIVWHAGESGIRTEWMDMACGSSWLVSSTSYPQALRMVCAMLSAVPDGASALWVRCCSMMATLSNAPASRLAMDCKAIAPKEKFGTMNPPIPASPPITLPSDATRAPRRSCLRSTCCLMLSMKSCDSPVVPTTKAIFLSTHSDRSCFVHSECEKSTTTSGFHSDRASNESLTGIMRFVVFAT